MGVRFGSRLFLGELLRILALAAHKGPRYLYGRM